MVTFTYRDRDGQVRAKEIADPSQPSAPATKTTTQTIVGLDLGQRSDFTALAYVERRQEGSAPAEYRVPRLRRWRETAYTTIRDELADRLPAWGLTRTDTLAVDGTGVGVAVVDIFTEARFSTTMASITITGGFEPTKVPGGWHVPKRELVGTVSVLLEQRRLLIADGLPEAAILKAELSNFRLKMTAAGNETFGAWRDSDHDDLVLAVALACWLGEQPVRQAYVY